MLTFCVFLALFITFTINTNVLISSASTLDDKFLERANHSLSVLRETCMYSWLYENPAQPISFPDRYIFPADAESHLAEINAIAQSFRQIPIHSYSNYGGPWIENVWIKHFEHLPVETFGGMIPLFFNWVDAQLSGDALHDIATRLAGVLRPNVLYVTVSQSDEGIHHFSKLHPNVLVLSAGGFGHIPIPLVKGEIEYRPPPKEFMYDVAFFGSLDRIERQELLAKALDSAQKHGFSTKNQFIADWKESIYGTKFNLSPRGYGRCAFRLAEVIQMGRIPIHLYNDVNWMPYAGTNLSVDHYGFYGGLSDVDSIMDKLKALTPNDLNVLFEKVKQVRSYYTYEGVMAQIEAFFRDPLGPNGGNLRCITVPRTLLCCGR